MGGKPFIHGTPVVADGEVQNTVGMKYSLVSRDLIADCIELMHDAYRADLLITIGGCDKSLPGTLMPLARGNHIGLTMYGGSASNGNLGCGQRALPGMVAPGDKLNAGSPYEAVGAYYAGDMDEEMVLAVEVCALKTVRLPPDVASESACALACSNVAFLDPALAEECSLPSTLAMLGVGFMFVADKRVMLDVGSN